ncbi:hypothetical protein D3C83_233810 [compost metagenome]
MARISKQVIMIPDSVVASSVIFVIFLWSFTSGQNMERARVSPKPCVIPPGKTTCQTGCHPLSNMG